MVGVLLAIAANATDWYLCGGNLNGGSSWADNPTYLFTPDASDANIQTYSIAKITGEIKIKEKGTWSTSFGSNGSKLKEGVEYKAGTDGSNIVIDGSIEDATITINTSAHTVKITGKGSENEYSVVYLVGDFGSGWNENNTSYPLTLKSGTNNVWEGTYTFGAATSYFKMKAGSLIYGTGGDDIAVEMNNEYTAAQSGNAFNLPAGKYNFSFVLNKNADTGKLTVSQDGPVAYPEILYVVGNVKGSEFAANVTEPLPATAEAGHYEGDITFTGTFATGFLISVATGTGATATDWAGLGTRYGAAEEDLVIGTEPVQLTGNQDWAWKLADGTYTLSVNLVDKTMTVVKKEEPTPGQPLEVTFDFTTIAAMKAFIPTMVAAVDGAGDWITDTSAKSNLKWPMNPVNLTHDGVNLFYQQANPQANKSNLGCVYYISGSDAYDFRVYKTNQMTIAAPEGYAISEITFTTAHTKINVSMPGDATGTLGAYADKTRTWTADEGKPQDKVVFDIKETVRMNTIKVTLVKKETPQPTYPVLYFRGAMNDNAADEASLFTQTDGIYTITLDKLIGNFKIADADWGVQFSTKNTTMVLGSEYTVSDASGFGGDMAITNTARNVTITFDYNNMKLKIEGEYYSAKRGYVLNSSLTDSNWSRAEMTDDGNDQWEYVVTPVNATGELQIIGTYDGVPTQYYGSTDREISEENPSIAMYPGMANPKFSLTAGTEYKFTFDPALLTLTVAPTTEPIEYPELYFRGGNAGWDPVEANLMTQSDGVYTFSIDKLSAPFKIADAGWSADNSWTTGDMAMELDTEYTCFTQDNSPNMGMANNIVDATITFDYNTKALKITGTIDDVPVVVGYIIKGTFTDPEWTACEMAPVTENAAREAGQTYFYECEPAASTGVLLIVKTEDGVEKAWYKAATTDLLTANGSVTLSTSGADNLQYDFSNFDKVKFVFDPESGVLTTTGTTGIAGIVADYDENAEYYNMQGVRISGKPAAGLYIVVRGADATKEYLR
ncbi:MAG: hypothetical protein Q4C34_00680 [Bacteroidales bacterium]|nr:hypothetical protein [Bacteroidales bacterium]